ncbi:hypothetical protein Lsai_0142 [Legionella sainthelensi]|uniref:Uncharacterized protein n=1 Tax=Legionella sainthelensi TaxID=28087 RepID=A0A0W0YU47_9GAMM|nr:hypothetical protein [Legionella sainthelensi]KTD60392.1 hypothetical protein Lsai_0142 [Legionella sainthelensi]VEH34865.1 ankyrin repeat protein [Legionella sainthelensi]
MIAAISFYAFRQAVTKKHLSVVLYLLNYPNVFAYAEIHQHEYDEQYVRSFIFEKLTDLRTDEHTFATRFEHFIDELAHIRRAHNWDQSRRTDNGKLEQYDDLEGDRPSCFSGVKRRLFQSVFGHPLLKLVTEDVIKAEINEFLVTHFKKTINPNNCIIIKKAWDKGIEGELLSEEDMKAIQILNVSLDQQKAFKNYLSPKYGFSFAVSLNFINLVDKTFELTLTTSSHLFKHGSLMVEFFNKLQATKEDVGQSLYRFFAVSASNLRNSEAPSTSIIPKR